MHPSPRFDSATSPPSVPTDPEDGSTNKTPMSLRPTRKRPASTGDLAEGTTQTTERPKRSATAKLVTPTRKPAARGVKMDSTKPGESGAEELPARDSDWSEEECDWIRLYYHTLLYGVSNHSVAAPKNTVVCAYFNAYFEGYMTDSVKDKPAQPIHPKRTFRSFHQKCQELEGKTLKTLEAKSAQKPNDAILFQPTITPSLLHQYREIVSSPNPSTTLPPFLQTITTTHLTPQPPTWQQNGLANIHRRPPISLAGYTAQHLGELDQRPSAARQRWHQDPSNSDLPQDSIVVSHGVGVRERFRLARRKVHADVGSAVLNMADLRPRDGDGDVITEGEEVADASRNLEEGFEAVKAGDALREWVFKDAEWPPRKAEADEVAAVLGVRRSGDGE